MTNSELRLLPTTSGYRLGHVASSSSSLTGIPDLDKAVLAAARQHGADAGREAALVRGPGDELTAEAACAAFVAEVGGGVIAVSFAAAGMDPDIAWEFASPAWCEAFVAAYGGAVVSAPMT